MFASYIFAALSAVDSETLREVFSEETYVVATPCKSLILHHTDFQTHWIFRTPVATMADANQGAKIKLFW